MAQRNISGSEVRLASLHYAFLSQSITEKELCIAETRTSMTSGALHMEIAQDQVRQDVYKALMSRAQGKATHSFHRKTLQLHRRYQK